MEELSEERKRELRRRLEILKEQMASGKVHFMSHLAEEMERSLLAVRYGPDGEIDLSTVDARVRATALAITAFKDREDAKEAVSLADIQRHYFDLLENSFGNLRMLALEHGKNPQEFARAAARDPKFVDEVVKVIPRFMEVLTEFWSALGESAHVHAEDATSLKAVFGGDLFPSAFGNIASTCGIYIDTIILPDPFLRSANLFDRWSPERRTFYFVKHALNVLQYRELALADVAPPIIAVIPDRSFLEESEQKVITSIARADAIVHAGKVFGRSFSSFEEALDYVDQFEDLHSVGNALVQPDRVLFDVEWSGTFVDQAARALKEQPEWAPFISRPGRIILFQAVGRMGQSGDLLFRTQRLGATPVIEATTSWRYLQWKLEYDAGRMDDELATERLHVTRALQVASDTGRVAWLGRVPVDALIQLRKEGGVNELRSTVSDGVARLASADPSDFAATADVVVANLDKMFADHEAQVRQLSTKLRRFGFKDVGSWVVIGGIEIAAAATGAALFGLAALAGDQLFDVPKLKDMPAKIRSLIEESQRVRRSPVGVLFKSRDSGS